MRKKDRYPVIKKHRHKTLCLNEIIYLVNWDLIYRVFGLCDDSSKYTGYCGRSRILNRLCTIHILRPAPQTGTLDQRRGASAYRRPRTAGFESPGALKMRIHVGASVGLRLPLSQ